MHTTFYNIRRNSRFAILLLATSILLYGCASQNPLIDDPNYVPAAASENKAFDKPQETLDTYKIPSVNTQEKISSDSLNTLPPSGLSRIVNIFRPYKIDIQQGNFISHEMLA